MKVRTGFVSNSSSSSFTAVLSRVDYDVMIASLGPVQQAIMEHHDITEGMNGHVMFTFCDGEHSDFDNMDKEAIIELAKRKGLGEHEYEAFKDEPWLLTEEREPITDAVCKLKEQNRAMTKTADF